MITKKVILKRGKGDWKLFQCQRKTVGNEKDGHTDKDRWRPLRPTKNRRAAGLGETHGSGGGTRL